jgi:LDH2 family malate/lactate/ureidoglycolate dehydrogenase
LRRGPEAALAQYPRSETERRIPAASLRDVVAATFRGCFMSDGDAALLADALVRADLRAIHSHGVLRVPDYVAKLTREGVDPRGRPTIVREVGAVVVVDGGNSMGQIGGTFAMRAAIARARAHGLGAAAVRGSNHCGAMDHYAMLALPHDMIGIASSNALPTMAPWGGLDKIVGMNPLAVAIPAAEEAPIVLDIAFGATAHGKIRVYHQKGAALPDGWAFDAAGRPTTDAAAALDGLIQPIGGHKGIGLAVVTGVLSTLLSSAAYGTELGNMIEGAKAGADGHFFMALDIAAFGEPAAFKARVDAVVRQIHASRTAPGVERAYAPGALEAKYEARYRRDGIPLNDATLAGVAAAARERGADASLIAPLL